MLLSSMLGEGAGESKVAVLRRYGMNIPLVFRDISKVTIGGPWLRNRQRLDQVFGTDVYASMFPDGSRGGNVVFTRMDRRLEAQPQSTRIRSIVTMARVLAPAAPRGWNLGECCGSRIHPVRCSWQLVASHWSRRGRSRRVAFGNDLRSRRNWRRCMCASVVDASPLHVSGGDLWTQRSFAGGFRLNAWQHSSKLGYVYHL